MDQLKPPATMPFSAEHTRLWAQVNDTDTDDLPTTVAELLLGRMGADPEGPAIVAARASLTFEEVLARANALVTRLPEPGGSVLICAEPGWEQLVAVFAALLAGTPCHLVDPAATQSARWHRVTELDATVVLTQSWLAERLRWPTTATTIAVDTTEPATEPPPPRDVRPDAVAVLLDNLRPPGAALPVTHAAIADTIVDLAQRLDLMEDDRTLVPAPLSDPSALCASLATLAVGGTVVIPDDLDLHTPSAWFELIRREEVTIWSGTPTLTSLLAEHLGGRGETTPSLRLALVAGEPFPPHLVRRLRGTAGADLRIAHLGVGGPAGLWSTYLEIDQPDLTGTRLPIGAPLANKRAFVLSDAMTLCPVWVTGRLYVGGRGMPAVPRDGFVIAPGSGEILHRTDLSARLLPDGTIDVIGDDAAHAVVHGHPFNLRDVEGLLTAHPDVLGAAVVISGQRPTAFVKTAADAALSGADLLDLLRRRMSPYLLPQRVELVRAFALTPAGRIDRATLVDRARAEAPDDPSTPPRPDGDGVSGELLERACQIAARVLGLSDVEETMNLLDLGATSVQLVRIATQTEQELGIEVDVEELLRFPSVTVLISSAKTVTRPDEPVEGRATELILDPVDRATFKGRRPGLRSDLDDAPRLPLASPRDDDWLASRRTYRAFATEPVPGAGLSALLAALRVLHERDADPKYAYPSAGGLYPVQTYLTAVADRVDGVPAGAYYYDPVQHHLVTLSPGATVDASAYGWINGEAARSSAFALYLVADLDAIEPMYGPRARDYCLIEAGGMAQLLMTVASTAGLGLCPVGEVTETQVRTMLRLGDRQQVALVLLGGVPPAEPSAAAQAQQDMLRRLSQLPRPGSGEAP